MKKGIIVFSVALLAIFFFMSGASAQKQIELSYSIFYPSQHKHTLLAAEWAKEIEKRTNGKVKITIFPGGTLAAADKCYQSVVTGIADIGFSVLNYTRGRFPLMEGLELPYGVRTSGTKMIAAYYKKFQPKELNDTKVMYLHGHGPGLIHTRKAVATLEDLKGLKIRAGGSMTEIVTQLGAVPVGMTMGEAYDGLSKGVVEGIIAPYEALEGFKLAEVVKHTTECYGIGYTTVQFIVMNKNKWNSLPPDIQKTIEKVNEEWVDKTFTLWNEVDKSAKEFAFSRGHKTIQLSKEENERWTKAVSSLVDNYIKNARAKGVPAEEGVKFCIDYLKRSEAQ
jgi:TRAP-type transport system periplasmic protein